MRVVHIILESFNRRDAEVGTLADFGFKEYKFDGRPVISSVESLYAVQTGQPYAQRNPSRVFDDRKIFMANYAKTRIFSRPFPQWTGVETLDPLTRFTQQEAWHEGNPTEPDSKLFANFCWFLKKLLLSSDYKHVIYCATAGHADWRLAEENKGVPETLRKTFTRSLGVIVNQVLPLIDIGQTAIFIHPDHGTTRQNQSYDQAMFDSFLWAYDPHKRLVDTKDVVTWDQLRSTLAKVLGVDHRKLSCTGKALM